MQFYSGNLSIISGISKKPGLICRFTQKSVTFSMIRNHFPILILSVLFAASCGSPGGHGTAPGPEPYGPVPTEAQLKWQRMERNLFLHFGPNTFSGKEWGDGMEPEDLFAPTGLDCRQWARTAAESGFKGLILTGKHHDGFCLWPNPESRHTVAQSAWRGGRGAVLRELSDACREYGLSFGVYISPWDRNDPHYGSDAYNDVYVRTLQSALSSYGPVYELWFDGAHGEGPNGKRQVYDWPRFHETVRSLQPDAVMFSDIGPGCRWCGNERGYNGRTSWSTLSPEGFTPGAGAPPRDTLQQGNVHGTDWIPSEVDVSIRPGWFWKESENDKVKTLDQLLEIYYRSVGRNALLLLNVPPDTRGRLHETDSTRLMEFSRALDEIFSEDRAKGASVRATSTWDRSGRFDAGNVVDADDDSYWAAMDGDTTPWITLELPEERTFNRILLQEYLPLGQRIASFTIDAIDGEGNWKRIAEETTVGYKRIVCVPEVRTRSLRLCIERAYAPPVLSRIALFEDRISPYLDK